MNRTDAVRAMLDGKKVQHDSWMSGRCLYAVDGLIFDNIGKHSPDGLFGYTDGWEIVEVSKYDIGTRFYVHVMGECMLVQVRASEFALIDVKAGNRLRDPIKFVDTYCRLTMEQVVQLAGGRKCQSI